MDTSVIEIGCGSLLKIIHVAVEDTADELSELNVTEEVIDELDELVVDDEVNNQLRGGSSSSLGTWNQNIVDNQLEYSCSLRDESTINLLSLKRLMLPTWTRLVSS